MPRITSSDWEDSFSFLKDSKPLKELDEEAPLTSILKPFREIKEAGLDKYYHYNRERAAIRLYEAKLPSDEAERQAMNDTIYKFMEDNHVDMASIEVNQFIKRMVK